jgi:glucosamine--fructose-6-phosphate aminotransferase (isomerizing)
MCGIVGYIGKQNAWPILIEELKNLEYRGYDSAGMALVEHAHGWELPCELSYVRTVGKVEVLEKALLQTPLKGKTGIAHTRWATHGEPSEKNAHPHISHKVAVVHNGIIENYESLRAQLIEEGYRFVSDTDTEVLPHLIEREIARGAQTFEDAVQKALQYVEGAYAIAVVCGDDSDEIVAACNSSPLVIGIGKDELYLASDELAFGGKVDAVVHLKDGEIVRLCADGTYTFRGLHQSSLTERLEKPSVTEAVTKGGFAHYMYKEILEQPQAMRNVLAGRLREGSPVVFGGFTSDIESRLKDARRIMLVGCGTSLFAGMTAKNVIESLCGTMCEVEQAAEFAYRNPALTSSDIVVAISQSGETADTLRAFELAKERHALCIGITNRVGSTLAKRTRVGIYLHAGPEIAVASTKAFTAQATALLLFALRVAELKGIDIEDLKKYLQLLPILMTQSLKQEAHIKALAEKYKNAQRVIVIGRGSGVALAMEAALKIREVSYIDAHGLSAAELKHGTLALVEKGVPVVAIMPQGTLRGKMLSNLEEVKTRGGEVVLFEAPADIPQELVPIVLAPQLQLLAYHLGVVRGVDVDQPRNLAKSVTVE